MSGHVLQRKVSIVYLQDLCPTTECSIPMSTKLRSDGPKELRMVITQIVLRKASMSIARQTRYSSARGIMQR